MIQERVCRSQSVNKIKVVTITKTSQVHLFISPIETYNIPFHKILHVISSGSPSKLSSIRRYRARIYA